MPDIPSIVQLEEIRGELTQEQKRTVTISLADMMSSMHSITTEVLLSNSMDRRTDIDTAKQIIKEAFDIGFITQSEFEIIMSSFEELDPVYSLVHKDIYTENLLIDALFPDSISAVIDLEHAEISGIGQDFYALSLFFFPRMGEEYRKVLIDRYILKRGITLKQLQLQIITFGMARACEVFLQGNRNNIPILMKFANDFKQKELSQIFDLDR